MPRPSLPDDERRSRRVLVRLSPREHDELRRRAGIARLGVPEFLRRAALGRRFRLQAPRRLAAADRRDLTRLGIQPQPDRPGSQRPASASRPKHAWTSTARSSC